MTSTEKIFAILSASPGVTAYVPANRIKPVGDWQELPAPYIVQLPVTAEPTHCHDGLKAFRIVPQQVSVFAYDAGTAELIGAEVIAALDGHCDADVDDIAFTAKYMLGYDTDLKLAHLALDFAVAGALL